MVCSEGAVTGGRWTSYLSFVCNRQCNSWAEMASAEDSTVTFIPSTLGHNLPKRKKKTWEKQRCVHCTDYQCGLVQVVEKAFGYSVIFMWNLSAGWRAQCGSCSLRDNAASHLCWPSASVSRVCRSILKSLEQDLGNLSQQNCNGQLTLSTAYQYRLNLAVICTE